MHGVICPLQVFSPEFTVRCITKKKNIAFSMQSIENGMSFLSFFFLKQGFKLKISRLIITKIIPPIINTFITACKILHENSMISRKRHNYFNETYNVHKKIVHGSG